MKTSLFTDSICVLPDFPEDKDSSGSEMSEYDWSEDSEEDLGSPTKMPSAAKKSNIKVQKVNPVPSTKKTKSVHFPDKDISANASVSTEETTKESVASSPRPAQRPSNLTSDSTWLTSGSPRPSKPPPPRPEAPPAAKAPTRPPRKPLTKPSGIVKPNAPPPPPPKTSEKVDKKLVALMEEMDRELAGTEVGKSFERDPKPVSFQFFVI